MLPRSVSLHILKNIWVFLFLSVEAIRCGYAIHEACCDGSDCLQVSLALAHCFCPEVYGVFNRPVTAWAWVLEAQRLALSVWHGIAVGLEACLRTCIIPFKPHKAWMIYSSYPKGRRDTSSVRSIFPPLFLLPLFFLTHPLRYTHHTHTHKHTHSYTHTYLVSKILNTLIELTHVFCVLNRQGHASPLTSLM